MNDLIDIMKLDANRAVRASAGTGKTFHLAKRYCSIIDDYLAKGLFPRRSHANILVITFTRKAAAEMKVRIYEDLKVLLDGNLPKDLEQSIPNFGLHLRQTGKINAAQRQKLLIGFSENNITTIDSFAAMILREFGDRLELDSQFRVAELPEFEVLFEEVFHQVLAEKSVAGDPYLLTILTQLNRRNLSAVIRQILEHHSEYITILDEYAGTEVEEIWRRWMQEYAPDFDAVFARDFLDGIVQEQERHFKHLQDDELAFLIELESALRQLPAPNEPDYINQLAQVLADYFLTKKGTYGKQKFGAIRKAICSKTILAEYDLLKSKAPETELAHILNDSDHQLIPVLQALAHFYQELYKELVDAQIRRGLLTFDTVVNLAWQLVTENSDVAEALHQRFDHILFDEFQDTNRRRWEIVKALFKGGRETFPDRGLFLVGDTKQSIYSFQHADVSVFQRAVQDIPHVVHHTLTGSFRATKELNDYVFRPLFENLLKADGVTPPDAFFTHAEIHNANKKINPYLDSALGHVHFVTLNGNESTGENMSALHCASVVKEALAWWKKSGLTTDGKVVVAVLLRAFTTIADYQRVFNDQDIPFEIYGGKGLFHQQETYDLYNLLSILDDPLDDLALTGLLRSPWFLLSDPDIQTLFEAHEGQGTLLETLKQFPAGAGHYEVIQTLRTELAAKPLSVCLNELLIQDYRLLGYVSESDGAQRLANLHKLLDMLAGMESEGVSLRDMRLLLKLQIENDKNSGAQATRPGTAEVQLMTIHAAKGLQFPIVILPQLLRKGQNDTDKISYAELTNRDGEKRREVAISSADQRATLITKIKAQKKRENEAEEKRLFYVAVTRAQYQVWFLGEGKKISNSGWWQQMLCPVFPQLNDLEQDWEDAPLYWSFKQKSFTDIVVRENTQRRTKIWLEPEKKPQTRFLLHETPHSIMEKINPRNNTNRPKSNEGTGDFSRVIGTIFHKMIEMNWHLADDKAAIREFQKNEFPNLVWAEVKTALEAHWQYWSSSDLLLRVNAADCICREWSVTGYLNTSSHRLRVNGNIDLLFREHGRWAVVDFKTDKDLSALETYRIQIWTYLWIVKQSYGIDAEGILYFTGLDHTETVLPDDSYFNSIAAAYKFTWPPIPEWPPSVVENKGLTDYIKSHRAEKITLVHGTRLQAAQWNIHLAAKKMLSPLIRSITLDDLIIDQFSDVHQMSGQLQRLLLRAIAVRDAKTLRQGQVAELSAAVNLLDLNPHFIPLAGMAEIMSKLDALKQEYGIISSGDKLRQFSAELLDGMIILNGFHGLDRSEILLWATLAEQRRFYYTDPATQTFQRGFPFALDHWQQMSIDHLHITRSLCHYFSVWEEVEAVAEKLTELTPEKWQQTVIAVSSTKRYQPAILQVFARYGLPFTSSESLPLKSFPAARRLLALLRLVDRRIRQIDWNDVLEIARGESFLLSRQVQRLEQWRQNNGWEYWFDMEHVLQKSENEPEQRQNLSDLQNYLRNLKSLLHKGGLGWNAADAIHAEVVKIICEEDTGYEEILKILENTRRNMEIARIPATASDWIDELISELGTHTVSIRRDTIGPLIVGFVDAMHLKPEHLYVLGLNDDQFPPANITNRYIESADKAGWGLAVQQLLNWERQENIHYSCASQDLQGNELTPTIFAPFFNGFKEIKTSSSHPQNIERHFLQYSRTEIKHEGNQRILDRHNDYQQITEGQFRGRVQPWPKPVIFSIARFDALLQCPMKYTLAHICNLKSGAKSRSMIEGGIFGTLIHHVAEQFFNQNRVLQREKRLEYCRCLADIFAKNTATLPVSLIEDPVFMARLRPYEKGLAEADPDNLLVRLLDWHLNEFAGYDYLAAEYSFNYKLIHESAEAISFNGRMDLLFFNEREQRLLITDIKTGHDDSSHIRKTLSSQLPLYYLASETLWIDKEPLHSDQRATVYEKIQSLNECDLMGIVGDLKMGSKKPVLELHKSEVREKYLARWFERMIQLRNGEWFIADRERNEVCKYCEFDKVCRKSSKNIKLKDDEND